MKKKIKESKEEKERGKNNYVEPCLSSFRGHIKRAGLTL